MKITRVLFLKRISVTTKSRHIFYKYKAVVRRVLKHLVENVKRNIK
jgi:hypothetical protein